tara:strand:- start:1105 stop:1389 length:285 start_codon:yes stop_codon:yes gene_type:complete
VTERLLQNYLVRKAKQNGVYARKVVAVGNTGFPDVFLLSKGTIILVELKSPTGRGRLSEKQKSEIAQLIKHGAEVRVIDNYKGVDDVIGEINAE